MVATLVLAHAYAFCDKLASDIISLAKDVVTIVAIVVGGYWTFFLFVKNRTKYPHANIKHKIEKLPLNGKTLLRVHVIITNIGNVKITIKECETRLYRVSPLLTDTAISDLTYDHTGVEYNWPLLNSLERNIAHGDCFIEPQETDEIIFDFIVAPDMEWVNIYSHVNDIEERMKKNIGWQASTMYPLKGETK